MNSPLRNNRSKKPKEIENMDKITMINEMIIANQKQVIKNQEEIIRMQEQQIQELKDIINSWC